jgi:uncharacterized protein YbjT (DUF2867 family)
MYLIVLAMDCLIDPSDHALMTNTTRTITSATTTTLVIGATGKTGRRVAERLSAAGVTVRAASRSGEVRFDWNDRTTWAPALTGADAAYITYYPDLAFPGAADVVGAFAELAVAHGVRRLVLLSGRGEEGARLAEQRVQDSGADWTLVRCAFFDQNFDEAFADAICAGVLAVPGGQTVEPFLDADDIADVVVAALTDERHIGELYELTGPRLMSFADVTADLSAVLGREVRHVPLSTTAFTAELVAAGFPEGEAVPIAELFAEVLDGRNSHLTDGVQQALGREPRDFVEYARYTAATGVWNRAEVRS